MSTAISLHAVDYPRQAGTVHAIRHTVFVLGQGIDPALEQDSHDVSAVHVLAVDAEGQPVATARMVIDPASNSGRIGRMAVLPAWRNQGIGRQLLDWLGEAARERGLDRLTLHAQLPALPLYLRAGYLPAGPQFDEAGLPHLPLQRRLDGTMAVADDTAAQAALACIISTTGRHLRLLAPALDPGLLDAPLVLESLRSLAARRQPTTIQVLVDDPLRIARSGGPVLALIQRLPSVFCLRQRDLERTTSADALAVNDRGYSLARTNADLPEGTAGLPWRPAAQRLQQQFEQHWANSRECPELRPLRL